MRFEKKKIPADYGLFCFRLSRKEREELIALLDRAKERLNRGRKPDEYVVTKNQILFGGGKARVAISKAIRN